MGFTKHWPRMKNHGMENQEVLLVRIKWKVPLNLGMGNYYLYSALLIRDFFLHQCFTYPKLQQRR
jgi:hypothetical protein